MRKTSHGAGGFTIVELAVGLTVFAVVALSFLAMFIALVSSAVVAKQKAVASSLATNQMEYLKSLPYDSLAIAGGAIYSATPLPATSTQKVNGVKYTIKSSINYVDDAYDGCASYPSQALKELYCRNYPAPTGAPNPDPNPADYKSVHVTVMGPAGKSLAEVDTQIAAKVSETASTTGALFVKIIDPAGNPISGATITVTNTTITPNINASDSSDSNGVAIFYGLPPDSGYDYKITGSKTNYSSLTTIVPSGSLTPTYPNQNILTQQSSSVTLTLKLQGANSLVIETVNTSGAALPSAKIYVKGGYKKYTATTDTSYYYDGLSPSDIRPTTDASGLAALTNLVPGNYIFCGDAGSTSCAVGGTTYYLAAAVPYGGTNTLNPITVPTYDSAAPPSTLFTYGATSYYQEVRLIMTTSSSYPRLNTVTPNQISLGSDPLSSFVFTIKGTNLPCSASAASCSTTVKVLQGANTYTASCTGAAAGVQLNCTINLSSGLVAGNTQLVVITGGNTLTLPDAPLIGGFVVTP